MRAAEWPLIVFTLLTQIAVGMFVAIWAANIYYISKSNHLAARAIADKILLSIVVILVLAILASFLHTGKPKSAAYAVSHFSRSWLSREIAFLLLFTLLAGISFATQQIMGASNPFHVRFAVLSGMIGIITILSMAKVYMLETVPVWNSFSTPVQFISTSLVLGGLCVIVLLALFGGGAESAGPLRDTTKRLLAVYLLVVAANLVTFLIHLFLLPGAGLAGAESFHLLTGEHIGLLLLRLILLLMAVVLFCVLLFADTNASTTLLLIILCTAVCISEIIGRYLFYASYSRVGM